MKAAATILQTIADHALMITASLTVLVVVIVLYAACRIGSASR